jgi:hypothetical protein
VVFLPSAWRASRQALAKGTGTVICDHCNTVKSADGQIKCRCGGCFRPLEEMKWIDRPDASPTTSSTKVARQPA